MTFFLILTLAAAILAFYGLYKLDEYNNRIREAENASENVCLVENLEIPSRAKKALIEANVKTVAEIENLDGDLTQINGIGEAYAEKIEEAINSSSK